ncbi:hypothetical protein J5N97_003252 [Dioscorea zingiberensis]|uniref:DUF4283 domain-containing protein n=1 Tax=Dioscorea zingiberensis TaxID=325984 RepID=A0A9D5D4A9_9LILI|nr:hypothetical protein J5N97_003252 [Dioscorea zingiberensis]
MMERKEQMKHYFIPTERLTNGGMPVDARSLSTALQVALGDHWEWSSRPLRDGRFLVECPSSEEARGLEGIGTLHLPRFSLSFEQWSPDIAVVGKAEGEKRWVLLKDVPFFCWHRDVIAKLVEPVGELIFSDERGYFFVDDVRAAIRVRQVRELPAIIRVSIGTRKHEIIVEMEPGQAGLPWSKVERTRSGATPPPPEKPSIQGEQASGANKGGRQGTWTRKEKGKAPAGDLEHMARVLTAGSQPKSLYRKGGGGWKVREKGSSAKTGP